jgi:hypothetical protein
MPEIQRDDLGLNNEELIKRTQELETHFEQDLRRGPEKIYLIFDSEIARNKALKAIDEVRQHDDLFRYLKRYHEDPNRERSDIGMELEFTNFTEGRAELVRKFFEQKGLAVNEEYDTRNGETI